LNASASAVVATDCRGEFCANPLAGESLPKENSATEDGVPRRASTKESMTFTRSPCAPDWLIELDTSTTRATFMPHWSTNGTLTRESAHSPVDARRRFASVTPPDGELGVAGLVERAGFVIQSLPERYVPPATSGGVSNVCRKETRFVLVSGAVCHHGFAK